MVTPGTTPVERGLRKVLAPVCAASGAVVVLGFFFPAFVGAVVSGVWWLVVSLAFFGSGLGYLALLPGERGDAESHSGVAYLLRIRRLAFADAVRQYLARRDPVTFGVPVAVLALFFAAQLVAPAGTVAAVNAVRDALLGHAGWLFQGATLVAVLYVLFLLVGPWGEVKLGGPDTEPAYTYPTYFSLVFTAGIAAGIVFWGPAEALFHYRTPPPGVAAPAESGGAVVGALAYSLFHWGLSAWSVYAVLGVPIAYFVYQRGAPLRVSAILTPFLGADNLDSAPAKLVDTLAVFATIGGIATSVALVSRQFLAGIDFHWGVATGTAGPLLFVGGLTAVVIISAATGVHRGIRRLAGLNVVLFGLFAGLVAAVGPTGFVLDRGAAALGRYAAGFVPMSLRVGGEWVAAWTAWNWSWWFSWAPFAGLFLAALSRGRRIRTVVFTCVVATAAATVAWFILLGGTALHAQRTGAVDLLGAMAAAGASEAVVGFPLLVSLPLGQLLVFLFLSLIVVFIATSADTSTLVVSVLSTRQDRTPTVANIAVWGAIQGVVAASVLLLGGGQTLQAVAVLTGGPFAVLALVALTGLTLSFRRREGGHVSPVRRLWERLPDIQAHHDLDPPGDD